MTILHTLSADVNLLAGQPVTGYARIEAVGLDELGAVVVVPAIRDTDANMIFTGPQRIKLINGLLLSTLEDPVQLPDSTGQPSMSPAAWSYRVTLLLDHLSPSQYPVYVFQLGTDLDLADVISVPPITDPLDTPWTDAAIAAEQMRDEAQAFRDELVGMLDDTETRREGNRMDVTSRDFHPSSRPRVERFDGTSHPLSEYFPDLAAAQVVYPFATSLSDETDWAALQAAVLAVATYPRAFGSEASDWRQYGTAALMCPAAGHAIVNRPITKAANTNQNILVTSPAPWSFRFTYTGGDGGRLFDFQRDSVGSVLVIENVVWVNAGVRVWAPFRGPVWIGNGCEAIDTPHPAIEFVDTPTGIDGTGVGQPAGTGVVGGIVEKFYTQGCAGSVWQRSSTATITVFRDSRCISNRDECFVVDGSTDVLSANMDFMGMEVGAAAAGKGYIRVAAELETTNQVDIRDIRLGSESFTVGAFDYQHPKVPIIIGPQTGTSGVQLGIVRLRKVSFRTPATVSAALGRAAIALRARVTIDIDDCDFGEYFDYLVHEEYVDYTPTVYAGPLQSRWGNGNTVDAGHTAPLFSHGGVTFETPGRLPSVVDKRIGHDVSDDANLLSTDLTTWTIQNGTLGARTAGGAAGTHYYPVTKTGAALQIFKTAAVVAGRRYVVGFNVRREAGSAIRTVRLRTGIGSTVTVDQRQIRLDTEWTTVWFRIPYVAASGSLLVTLYMDNDEEAANGQTVGIQLPFLSEGWTPRIPRSNVRISPRLSAPASPVAGTMYAADGTTWDPLARAAGLPYAVFWNGSAWHAVSNVDPGAPVTLYGSEVNAAGAAATQITDPTTAAVMWTAANMPAGSLVAGQTVLRFRIHGTIDNAAASGTFTVRLKVNAIQLGSIQVAPTQTNAATNVPWVIEGDIYVDTIGAGGVVTLGVRADRISTATGTVWAPQLLQDVAHSVNLSGGLQLSVEGITGTANAANKMRIVRALVQQDR